MESREIDDHSVHEFIPPSMDLVVHAKHELGLKVEFVRLMLPNADVGQSIQARPEDISSTTIQSLTRQR